MKKILLAPFAFFCAAVSFGADAPNPVFETTFQAAPDGKLIDNIAPAVPGKLMPGTKIIPSVIGDVLETEGKLNNGAKFDFADKLLLPEEFTVAGWVNLKESPDNASEKPYRTMMFFCRGENVRIGIIPGGIVNTQLFKDGEQFILKTDKGMVHPGKWTHIAYVYSVSNRKYELFINGVLRASRKNSLTKNRLAPFAIPVSDGISFGSLPNYFPMKGMCGRSRIYAVAMTLEQIIASEQDIAKKLLESLKQSLSGKDYAKELLDKIGQEEKQPVISLEKVSRFFLECDRITELEKLKANNKSGNAFLAYSVVDPMGAEQFFRDTKLPEERLNGKLLAVAAQNEYEPFSFVVKPLCDIKNFAPVIEPLKQVNGNSVIPSSAIDIRIVKVVLARDGQYQCGVLLHDDEMIKIDHDTMTMFMRLSFPDGMKYFDASKKKPFKLQELDSKNFPIYDSREFKALDLTRGVNQQFWLTLKTTEEMKPGLYTSSVKLNGNGKMLASIPLKVRILPFALPEPATNYDLSREFYTSAYYFDHLSNGTTFASGSIGQVGRSKQQVKAELENLREHGIRHPTIIMANNFPCWNTWKKPNQPHVHLNNADDMMKQRIVLLKEAGFRLKPFFLHTGGNVGFREFYNRKEHKEILRDYITRGNKFFKELLGHDDIYHYGLDEAEDERLKKEFEVWEDMNEMGAKVYTTLKKANVPLVAGKIAVAVTVHSPDAEVSRIMHDKGGLIWVYAQPFARIDSPHLHRKGYGYGVYFANYDGICNYSYNHFSPQRVPWDDGFPLTYVVNTADGVVDSPSWEAYREGIDDVRYATKLRQEIRKAKNGSDAAKRKIAEKAETFLAQVNIHLPEFDPGWVRLQIIDYLLDLTENGRN